MNGIKGFVFVTAGKVTFDVDWNKQDHRTTTEFTKIQIGVPGGHPAGVPFTLDPAKTAVKGMPPADRGGPDSGRDDGFNSTTKKWTVVIYSRLTESSRLY